MPNFLGITGNCPMDYEVSLLNQASQQYEVLTDDSFKFEAEMLMYTTKEAGVFSLRVKASSAKHFETS